MAQTTLHGKITNKAGKALANLRIEAWDKDLVLNDLLGSTHSDSNGQFHFTFDTHYFSELFLDRRPDVFFKVFLGERLIHSTENDVIWNITSLSEPITIIADWPADQEPEPQDNDGNGSGNNPKSRYSISGKIVDSNGVPLSNRIVEVLLKTIDNDVVLGSTQSDKQGNYGIDLSHKAITNMPDLQVKAYLEQDADNAAFSPIIYNATNHTSIDVIIGSENTPKLSEYEALHTDIQNNLGTLSLDMLKENEQQQNITYLSNKTGWDSRLTAMLAAAHQLGAQLDLDPTHVYALLRAGVPGDATALKSVTSDSAEKALRQAIEKKIIPPSETKQTTASLGNYAKEQLLSGKPFASVSSLDEMLGLRLDEHKKLIFTEARHAAGDDVVALWQNLEQKGFTASEIASLKLDGKLGFLTGNNVPLIKKLQEEFQINHDAELATNGLYKSSEWKRLITTTPEGITTDEYANYMANQVKLSYPTAVAGERINRNEIKLGENVPRQELYEFFHNNHSKNVLGQHPVKVWDGFGKLSVPAKAAAKTYERLYQMSPSDEAMAVLAEKNIGSAYQIAKLSQTEFLTTYGAHFPQLEQAERIHKKALEIYGNTLGLATTYLTSRMSPNLYAINGAQKPANNGSNASRLSETATIAYPTLEALFGDIDYCSCDHCKSVLSPAAYLVELLEFIDLSTVTHSGENPIEVLLDRRPDIQHIQLSCENTNMALPYIDLVNEILEYYIVNGNLDNLQGYDVTETMRQDELLAEPQYVNQAAYNRLKTKVYPYNLPFHQPLESLRLLFKMWNVSLEQALGLFDTALASRKEALALSDDEYETLTNLNYKNIPEYFGLPTTHTVDDINTAIASGKTFSRTVGISYEDLVALLKTNFINPGYALVSLFEQLNVNLTIVQQYFDGTLSGSDLDAYFPASIDTAAYGGDIKTWLTNNRQLLMGLVTLTDQSTTGTECSLAEIELRYALPDDTANRLQAITYHKLHRFLRILRKTGWSIDLLDNLMRVLLPRPSQQITEANIDATFITLLDKLANFKKLASDLEMGENKFTSLLAVWDANIALSLKQEQCARLLRLNQQEIAEIVAITALDPLADDLEVDQPSLLRLVMITRELKEHNLKVVDLAYLLRHRDLTGRLTLTDASLLKNIKILREAIATIEKENSIAPDNADFNFAKSKMLLVYDATTTDRFLGFLMSTQPFVAPLLTTEELLPAALSADNRLGFDAFKKELTYSGILSNAAKAVLVTAADNLSLTDMSTLTQQADLDTFIADFKLALDQIASDSNEALTAFGAEFPELKTIYDSVVVVPTTAEQLQTLMNLILPELKNRLKDNALRQALTGILKSEAETVSVLTGRREVTAALSDATKSVLFDFKALEETLLFDTNQTYTFYLDPFATDDYLIYLTAPQATVITLKVDGQTAINNATVGASKEITNNAPLPMKAGSLVLVELTIDSLTAGQQVKIGWKTRGISKTIIPDSSLYKANLIGFAKTSLIRLFKASQLQNLLNFSPAELDYFAGTDTETKDFINNLDTDGSITPAHLLALWQKIERLIYFKQIKKENEPEENTWLTFLKNPLSRNAQGLLLLEAFNGWKDADTTVLLSVFNLNRNDLSKLSKLKQFKETMQLITAVGYPAAIVKDWITANPDFALVAGIKETVKQNVTEASWLETMQTVNNPVRNLLRDALASYILQYQRPSSEITNSDKLYEYFLIDVEMDACMKTSRIRQALSTVQLFIQRCLMNLEPDVVPSSIKSGQWEWMKRYRVWEANRKVFLYPENWLEPDLRDNKSSLFKELEGELLQSEITDESAELAFLNYLKKLDDIANLEIVGMYLDENEQKNQADDILHVLGRTNGNTRQYYYRRYEYGYWTPWEKVSLSIEGEHVFPIVWKKRLFVFWVNTLEKPAPLGVMKSPKDLSNDSTPLSNNAKKNVEINLCWGEYYKGKWTSPKSTDLKRSMVLDRLDSFESNNLVVYGRKDVVEHPAGKFRERLIFLIRYPNKQGVFTFTSKNAPPDLQMVVGDSPLENNPLFVNYNLFVSPFPTSAELYNTRILLPGKEFKVNVPQPDLLTDSVITENLLTKANQLHNGFSVLPIRHVVENQFEAPFVYADEHSTFFVQPKESFFITIQEYDDYYPPFKIPVLEEIPPHIEAPIPGWPPSLDPRVDPRIDPREITPGNQWIKTKEFNLNPNFTKVLATTQTFTFGETEFGAGTTHSL